MYPLLFITGILLVILNWRAIKKEKNSFKNTFNNAAGNVQEFDIKIGEIRREFAETITELQREIIDLKELVENLKYSNNRLEIKEIGENLDYKEHELKKYENSTREIDEISYNKEEQVLKDENEKTEQSTRENFIAADHILHKEVEEKLDENSAYEEIAKETRKNNNFKIDDVRNLFNSGLSVEEIAAKLNIGKGEVLLIKELYLR